MNQPLRQGFSNWQNLSWPKRAEFLPTRALKSIWMGWQSWAISWVFLVLLAVAVKPATYPTTGLVTCSLI